MSEAVAAIIPAAGASMRLGGRIRKPFVPLNGRPLLAHTLAAFERSPSIHWILVVGPGDALDRITALIRRYRIAKALTPCAGGSSRADSVVRGVKTLPREARWVLIHDGARPCVTPQLIEACVRAAKQHGAVACGLPASSTVKAVGRHGDVQRTLKRDQLWFVQTPQVFRREMMFTALTRAQGRLEEFPDDASIVEQAGYRVRMIPGDPLNIKVTTREDLLLAEAILRRRVR